MGNFIFKPSQKDFLIEEEAMYQIIIEEDFFNVGASDKDKKGGLYVVEKVGSEKCAPNSRHLSFLLDINGQSNGSFKGLEFQLARDRENQKNLVLFIRCKDYQSNDNSRIFHYIGNVNGLSTSSAIVSHQIMGFHIDYLRECGGTSQWSSRYNCQSFVKYCTTRLGLVWPEELKIIPEEHECLVDFYIRVNEFSREIGSK